MDERGGLENYIRDVVAYSSGRHGTQDTFRHIVLSPAPITAECISLFPAEIAVLVLPSAADDYLSAERLPTTRKELLDCIDDASPDMIVSWQNYCHYLASDIGATLDIPAVWYEHDARLFSQMVDRTTRESYLNNKAASYATPDTIAFASHVLKSLYLQPPDERLQPSRGGYNGRHAVIVPVGTNTKRFARDESDRIAIRRRLGIQDDEIIVGYVVRYNDKVKDVEHFIAAAQYVSTEVRRRGTTSLHFLICGTNTSSDNHELVKSLAAADILGDCHLMGFQDDMRAIYSAMDVNVSTSYFEGVGLACLEGLAAGVPFVGTDTGLMREMAGDVTDDGVGSFTPPRQPNPKSTTFRELGLQSAQLTDPPRDRIFDAYDDPESVNPTRLGDRLLEMIDRVRHPEEKRRLAGIAVRRASRYDNAMTIPKFYDLIDTEIKRGRR